MQNALRRLYSAAEDMKLVASNGIPDANKRDYATQKIKLIQKAAQAGDIPIGKKDVRGFLVIQDKGAQLMTDFFDLLRDVPDEI